MIGVVLTLGAMPLFYATSFAAGTALSAIDGADVTTYPKSLKNALERQGLLYLPYHSLPQCAIDGIVSVEDKRFFWHPGMDPIAALRVVLQSILNDQQDHGGSTITQQLSRMILREPRQQRSVLTEIESQLRILQYTLVMEHEFSKSEILELYLNSAYYGRGAQGFAQAAKAYFRTDAGHLTIAQCFYMAGLPNAPTLFGKHPRGAAARKRYMHVVSTLRRNGYITGSEQKELGAALPFLPAS